MPAQLEGGAGNEKVRREPSGWKQDGLPYKQIQITLKQFQWREAKYSSTRAGSYELASHRINV